MAPRDPLRDAIRRYQESIDEEDFDEESKVTVVVQTPPLPPVVQGPLPTNPPTSRFAGKGRTAAIIGALIAALTALAGLVKEIAEAMQ